MRSRPLRASYSFDASWVSSRLVGRLRGPLRSFSSSAAATLSRPSLPSLRSSCRRSPSTGDSGSTSSICGGLSLSWRDKYAFFLLGPRRQPDLTERGGRNRSIVRLQGGRCFSVRGARSTTKARMLSAKGEGCYLARLSECDRASAMTKRVSSTPLSEGTLALAPKRGRASLRIGAAAGNDK